ncbi:MAG: c-type cytochrome [Acidimicrobiales bacterium]
MTEVPEYLLERSRARRAALGLAPTGGGEAPPAPAAAAPTAASEESAAPEPASVPAMAAAGGPPASALATEPAPVPVVDRGPRSGVPPWMMPVLLILPLWAIVYMGTFGERASSGPKTPEEVGAEVFTKAGCGSCHGTSGGGGVGPKLSGGEAALTFPDALAQEEFVKNGSAPTKGQPYGDPNRPGGQRVAKSGGMPTFGKELGGKLTDEEIAAVVLHERGL